MKTLIRTKDIARVGLSDYIAKAIGGRNHADKVEGYTKEYTKILEERE